MRVGELFAGIGGASLAVGMVYPDAETMWQADLVNEAVRARHFPDAAQLVGDVREVDPARLPRVDLLTAGFPCTDLSTAGKQEGLNGKNSRLYREVLRFCGARRDDLYADDDADNPRPWRVVFGGGYQPPRVLIENVPALLHYLPRLSADFRALGYGLTWTVCEAADAGLPHLRRRVFVLAELDRAGRGAVEVDQARRWRDDECRTWPTVLAHNKRISGRAMHGVQDDLVSAAFMLPWGTPSTSADPDRISKGTGGIVGQVRTWATATATDYKTPAGFVRTNHPPARIGEQLFAEQGRRLAPAWVEALMGYPLGWTEPEGGALTRADIPPPVRGRYPVGWDRFVPWPGFDWEPPRTIPDGVKAPGRTLQIIGLGNAWAPAQGALALRALLAPAQASLF